MNCSFFKNNLKTAAILGLGMSVMVSTHILLEKGMAFQKTSDLKKHLIILSSGAFTAISSCLLIHNNFGIQG
jgi:hypothetical protein